MKTRNYDRDKAVAYAHKWAMRRNPNYYNFDELGGDCTNFASQVLHAGAGVMNPAPTYGWYYYSLQSRAPAWTGVEYLYRFLIGNRRVGPVAAEVDISQVEPGDIVQISFDGTRFAHSPVVVSVGQSRSVADILVAAHTYDVDDHPLGSYAYQKLRFLHITHVHTW